jgi:hypothetical protein
MVESPGQMRLSNFQLYYNSFGQNARKELGDTSYSSWKSPKKGDEDAPTKRGKAENRFKWFHVRPITLYFVIVMKRTFYKCSILREARECVCYPYDPTKELDIRQRISGFHKSHSLQPCCNFFRSWDFYKNLSQWTRIQPDS